MNEMEAIERISRLLKEAFQDEIEIYTEHLVNFGNGLVRIADLVFEHQRKGIFIVEVKTYSEKNLVSTTRRNWSLKDWPDSLSSPFEEAALFLTKINANKGNLPASNLHAIVALPNITFHEWRQKKLGDMSSDLNNMILFSDDLDVHRLRSKVELAPSIEDIQIARSNYRKEFDVFISYRVEDSGWAAGRIYDYLSQQLESKIFLDKESIQLGDGWKDVLRDRILSSNVVLIIIGEKWLKAAHKDSGQRRLDDQNDTLRWEIFTALDRGVRVIPILIDNAELPKPDYLPEDLRSLIGKQKYDINLNSFSRDIEHLVIKLKEHAVKSS